MPATGEKTEESSFLYWASGGYRRYRDSSIMLVKLSSAVIRAYLFETVVFWVHDLAGGILNQCKKRIVQ